MLVFILVLDVYDVAAVAQTLTGLLTLAVTVLHKKR